MCMDKCDRPESNWVLLNVPFGCLEFCAPPDLLIPVSWLTLDQASWLSFSHISDFELHHEPKMRSSKPIHLYPAGRSARALLGPRGTALHSKRLGLPNGCRSVQAQPSAGTQWVGEPNEQREAHDGICRVSPILWPDLYRITERSRGRSDDVLFFFITGCSNHGWSVERSSKSPRKGWAAILGDEVVISTVGGVLNTVCDLETLFIWQTTCHKYQQRHVHHLVCSHSQPSDPQDATIETHRSKDNKIKLLTSWMS
jgi:hypothetical protein